MQVSGLQIMKSELKKLHFEKHQTILDMSLILSPIDLCVRKPTWPLLDYKLIVFVARCVRGIGPGRRVFKQPSFTAISW